MHISTATPWRPTRGMLAAVERSSHALGALAPAIGTTMAPIEARSERP